MKARGITGTPSAATDAVAAADVMRIAARLTVGSPAARRVRAAALPATPALGAYLAEQAVRLLRVDLDRAARATDALSWIAPRLGPPFLGVAARHRGHMALQRGRFPEALSHYRTAEREFRRHGPVLERARVLASAFSALSHLGRYDEAIVWARRARQIFVAHGDGLRAARVDANLAALLFRRDRPTASLRLGRRALRVFEQTGAVEDAAVTRLNTAGRLTALHAFPSALKLYERTRAFCAKHGLHLLALEIDGNLAYLYAQRGEYERALALYARVRSRALSAGHDTLATTLMLDEAELLVELNADHRAVAVAEQALTRSLGQSMPFEAAQARMLLAVCAARGRRIEEALRQFEAARQGFEAEGNAPRTALTDLHRAVLLAQRGVTQDAVDCAIRAREALRRHGLGAKVVLADLVLVRGALAAGDTIGARRHLARASAGLRRYPSPALSYQLAFLAGEVAHADDRPALARSWYRRAYRTLEGLRSRLGVDELRIAFLDDKAVVYESMARAALLLKGPGRLRETFAAVQQVKSRALTDLLTSGPHDPPAAPTAVQRLRGSLNATYREVDRLESSVDQPSPHRLEDARARARACEQRLSRAIYDDESRRPASASLYRGVASLADVQASLGDATLIEYFAVRGTLHAMVVERRRASVAALGPLDDVIRAVKLCLFNLSAVPAASRARGAGAPALAATEAHLRDLHTQLIAPIAHRLEPGRPLVIAPHGPLHRLPFHALRDDAGYLGDFAPIAIVPSGSVFALVRRRRSSRAAGALVLGLGDRRAPRITAEARTVGRRLPDARVLLGARASERAFRALAARSRVVHVATHGFFRAENPMFSSIRLANTRLDVHALYGLRLTADLVTLSGCSTGVNTVAAGDELVGLTRGLLHAGAACVQLSLWDVDDASTTHYMDAFYAHYAAGSTPAEASRLAMQRTRDRFEHPYHWAPFVVVGLGV